MKNRLMLVYLFVLIFLSVDVSLVQCQVEASPLLDQLIEEGLKNNPD